VCDWEQATARPGTYSGFAMSQKKLSALGVFATSGAADDATDALVQRGFPAADITVSSPASPATEECGGDGDSAAVLLTVQGNTAVEMEVAKDIIEQNGADGAASAGESVITTKRMDRKAASERIL